MIVAWAVIVVYVLTLVSRERRLQKEMQSLRDMVGAKETRR